eukprot:9834639-Heterocapsa_arctica.AAC.1
MDIFSTLACRAPSRLSAHNIVVDIVLLHPSPSTSSGEVPLVGPCPRCHLCPRCRSTAHRATCASRPVLDILSTDVQVAAENILHALHAAIIVALVVEIAVDLHVVVIVASSSRSRRRHPKCNQHLCS